MIVIKFFLALAYLALLGALLVPPQYFKPPTRPSLPLQREDSWLLRAFTLLGLGLWMNYVVLIVVGTMDWSVPVALLIAVIWFALGRTAFRGSAGPGAVPASTPQVPWLPSQPVTSMKLSLLTGAIVLALLFTWAIWTLALPVSDTQWDAKFIWFLHAKMIYFDRGLSAQGGWNLPDISFSHPDYPKLVPALAAQFAWMHGYWNAYVSKLSLVLLQVVGVIGVLAASPTPFVAVLMLVGVVLSDASSFTTGYIDAFLALYSVCATILLARAMETGSQRLWLAGLVTCGLLPGLKNEGLVLAALIVTVILVMRVWQTVPGTHLPAARRLVAGAVLVLLPCVAWLILRSQWNLTSDMQFGPAFWSRVWTRVSSKDLLDIILALGKRGGVVTSVLMLLCCTILLRWRLPLVAIACILVGVGFFIALTLVYLGTPNNLFLHLETSASRTVKSVHTLLFAGVAIALCAVAQRFERRA